MESAEPIPQQTSRESKFTTHVKQALCTIREGYSPKKVEQEFMRSYERILSNLDAGKAQEVFARLRPVFTTRAKLIGVASLVADVGLTAFLSLQSLRNVGLKDIAQARGGIGIKVDAELPNIATQAPLTGVYAPDQRRSAKVARLLGGSAIGVGLSAPFHRGVELYAKGEGFLGEKAAHIVNGIVSGRINVRDIGRYKMNTVRVGVGKANGRE